MGKERESSLKKDFRKKRKWEEYYTLLIETKTFLFKSCFYLKLTM